MLDELDFLDENIGPHPRESALWTAGAVARMLHCGANMLKNGRPDEVPLLARLPLLLPKEPVHLGKDSALNFRSPDIHEILLFGSVAEGYSEVRDVDLMVLDSGFYSMLFLDKSRRRSNLRSGSKDPTLRNNLRILLGWYMGCEDWLIDDVLSIPIDLHVLPSTVITDKSFRKEATRQHRDPCFFKNVFGCMMRYEIEVGIETADFVPITFPELRERLQTKA
jgi:hypothetical protein